MHGKVSALDIVYPDEILRNVPNGSKVMRYHSILADVSTGVPDALTATAYAVASEESQRNDRELMGIRHKELPIFGVQYHPESFGTEFGRRMIKNFCDVVRDSTQPPDSNG
jgi:anthranilate/para-aminobenzoate synthase component II